MVQIVSGKRIDIAEMVPEPILIVSQLLVIGVLIRFFCWVSWGSPRGDIALKKLGFIPGFGPGKLGAFKRWWFYLDENGNPK